MILQVFLTMGLSDP